MLNVANCMCVYVVDWSRLNRRASHSAYLCVVSTTHALAMSRIWLAWKTSDIIATTETQVSTVKNALKPHSEYNLCQFRSTLTNHLNLVRFHPSS